MRFLHLADLHFGKSIYGLSLIDSEDQKVWVDRFLELVKKTDPDAVVIAGDIYDRSSPSGEAVKLFDHMLTGLNDMDIPVLLAAGNHDSGQRLSFAESLLKKSGVYIAGIVQREIMHVTIPEKHGNDAVTFWLLPYLFPALVSDKLEDESIHDYDTAMRRLLESQTIDLSKKNVLIAHQNVTAFGKEVERGGSESMVGGVGQIDYTAFDQFDYVALGHIHSAYPVGRQEVRYAGSPLCYHFDELRQPEKGPLLVTIGEKKESGRNAEVTVETLKIPPLHPMRLIEGTYDEIREAEQKNTTRGEYQRIVLHDRRVTPEISDFFHNLAASKGSRVLELVSDWQNQLASGNGQRSVKEVSSMTLTQLFSEFYSERKNGNSIDGQQGIILDRAREITEQKHAQYNGKVNEEQMKGDCADFLKYIKTLAGKEE